MATIEPFVVRVPEKELADLQDRLRRTRWPEEVDGAGWDYGVPLAWMKDIVTYWAEEFDWRGQEARINAFPNFIADLDGFKLHFIHAKGEGSNRMPLLMMHGWPSSFVEYLEIIPFLVREGFDVIVPSLPGYGFSEIPLSRGFTSLSIANVMIKLMDALGYERFAVHAHDHGASVMSRMAYHHPQRIIGYHTTEAGIPGADIESDSPGLSEEEYAYFAFQKAWEKNDSGYARIQKTRPQTIAYALNDSPAGLAAWILDKWQVWTAPPSGNLNDSFSNDELLANVALYWLTGTVNYAGRAYYDNVNYMESLPEGATIDVPMGAALVATQGVERVPREYAARRFSDIRHWVEMPRGGHFIAGEEPELLAESIRDFLHSIGV
ncbi:MAG: epoxide hydrolase family protein [Thermomicrobiales bacterium]